MANRYVHQVVQSKGMCNEMGRRGWSVFGRNEEDNNLYGMGSRPMDEEGERIQQQVSQHSEYWSLLHLCSLTISPSPCSCQKIPDHLNALACICQTWLHQPGCLGHGIRVCDRQWWPLWQGQALISVHWLTIHSYSLLSWNEFILMAYQWCCLICMCCKAPQGVQGFHSWTTDLLIEKLLEPCNSGSTPELPELWVLDRTLASAYVLHPCCHSSSIFRRCWRKIERGREMMRNYSSRYSS